MQGLGIDIPVLPGSLPVLSLGQVRRFLQNVRSFTADFTGAKLTQADDENHPAIGAEWAAGQINELLQGGAPGYHIYALNKPQAHCKSCNP